MKKCINHKNGNVRKNDISNLEIIKEDSENESAIDILIELNEEERLKRFNRGVSKNNCIREDDGTKEFE